MQLIVLDDTKKLGNYERSDKNGNHECETLQKILPSFDGVCMALMSSKIDEIFLCCSVCFSNQFLSMIN